MHSDDQWHSCLPDGWRNERSFMTNHTVGWMGGWAGGQMLIWAVLAILVVVVVVIKSMIRKK